MRPTNPYWRTVTPAVAITTSMGESEKFPYSNAEGYRGLSRTRRACRQQTGFSTRSNSP